MKRIFSFFTIGLLAITWGQAQIPLRGTITVHNSREKTGKIEYVSGAQVDCPAAQPNLSDINGRFVLAVNSLQMGNRVSVYVFPPERYNGYVVVNEKSLKETVLGTDSIWVSVCPADELDRRKAEILGINMDNYVEKKQYIRVKKQLKDEQEKVQRYSDQWNAIQDSLRLIEEDEDRMLKELENYADQLVRINFDLFDENNPLDISLKKAYQCAQRGELDSVMIYMQNCPEQLQKALAEREKTRQKREAAQKVVDALTTVEQQQSRPIEKLVEGVVLLARTAKSQNNHADAEKYYQQAIQADSLNYDLVFEFAYYLNEIREYIRAESYFQHFLIHYEQLAQENLKVHLPNLGNVLNNLGVNYNIQKKYVKGESYHLRAVEIFEQLAQENFKIYLPKLVTVLNNLGVNYIDQKEYVKAEIYHLRALKIQEQLMQENAKIYLPNLGLILNNLGINYNVQKKYAQAGIYFLKAIEIYEQLVQEPPKVYLPNLGSVLNNLGANYKDQKEYAQAENYYLRALEIMEQLVKENPKVHLPDLASVLYNLGNNSNDQKEYVRAGEYYLRALEIREQLAQENPKIYLLNLVGVLNNLGINYDDQKKYTQAENYYLRALEIMEQLAQENPKIYLPSLAMALNNLGSNYKDQKEYAQAENYYLRTLEIREQLARENPKIYLPDLATILYNLGDYYYGQNKYAQAESYYLRALKIREQLAQENSKVYSPNLANILNNLGNNYYKQKEYTQAEIYYLRALEIWEQLARENPKIYLPDLVMVLNNLRNNCNRKKEYAQAESYHLQAQRIQEEQLAQEHPENFPSGLYNILKLLAQTYDQMKNYSLAVNYCQDINRLLNKYKEKMIYKIAFPSNCGNLAYYYLFIKEYALSEQYARQALALDSSQIWIKTNLAHALLFQNRIAEAEAIYRELSKMLYQNNETYTPTILEDFDALEKAGAIPQERMADVERIRKQLTIDN
jgi:tetratricopeptide (TPR) repeat protein